MTFRFIGSANLEDEILNNHYNLSKRHVERFAQVMQMMLTIGISISGSAAYAYIIVGNIEKTIFLLEICVLMTVLMAKISIDWIFMK